MKFFIDSADVESISQLLDMGVVDGVTTNPSLIAKSGRNIFEVVAEIAAMVSGPVSAEVVATEAEKIIKEGMKLAEISGNVVVKLPLTFDGLKACSYFAKQKIRTNVTLCFSATQALVAARAGASFVSPFVGRLDDISQDGIALIEDIATIFNNYSDIDTKLLVASARNPIHVLMAAKCGADFVTIQPKLLMALIKHPLTDKGLEIFLNDWAATGQKITS
jgi:transaldolase